MPLVLLMMFMRASRAGEFAAKPPDRARPMTDDDRERSLADADGLLVGLLLCLLAAAILVAFGA